MSHTNNCPLTSNYHGIGVFGGTFDPIHLGHMHTTQAVASWLNLHKVLFIPAHIPPHKSHHNNTPYASAEQRAAMVELACQPYNNFHCDRIELLRNSNSYTVDTLKALKALYPEQTLYFILGMDSLLTFTTWHKYREILTLCHLVVNTRPNYQLSTVNADTRALLAHHQVHKLNDIHSKKYGGIILAKPVNIDVSSTQIRQRIYQQQRCETLVSPQVLDFIDKNALYR